MLKICLLLFLSSLVYGGNYQLFPLTHYNQNTDYWINNSNNQILMSQIMQLNNYKKFLNHYYPLSLNSSSPWSKNYVTQLIAANHYNYIYQLEHDTVNIYDNKVNQTMIFGENFRPYEPNWLNKINNNLKLTQFKLLLYSDNNRAIIITNTMARILPTNDPAYFNPEIAGEGYPFDNLQQSALFIANPVYILGTSNDGQWDLLLTANYIAWVKAHDVAKTSTAFINTWTKYVMNNLGAVVKNNSTIALPNNQNLTAFIGTFLPFKIHAARKIILLPIKDSNNYAQITNAYMLDSAIIKMPYSLSSQHIGVIIKELIGRPYGWGGLNFYNDCSAELMNLFIPFGIYLPRNSKYQAQAYKNIDLSQLGFKQRIDYLLNHGKALLTGIYIKGHIMLYVGNFKDQNNNIYAQTYQNIWGLRDESNTKRNIIGQAVFLPLLKIYPEDESLNSLADRTVFKLVFIGF